MRLSSLLYFIGKYRKPVLNSRTENTSSHTFASLTFDNQPIETMVKHLNIKVYGKVQGVHYRANAMKAANNMGIKGFARNEKDGSVYIEAEGEDDALKRFIEWCYEGPGRANVERITTEEADMKNYSTFVVQR